MSEASSVALGNRFSTAERALAVGMRWTSMVCLVVLLVLASTQVLLRFLPVISMGWSDEIVELAFAWMVFLGTAVLWRDKLHITIDFVAEALAGSPLGRAFQLLARMLALAFLWVFTWQGCLLTLQAVGNRTPILELPKPLWYAAIPVSGAVMFSYTVVECLRILRPARAARMSGQMP